MKRLVLLSLLAATLCLPAPPALTQANHDADAQKTEQPQAVRPDAKPEGPTSSAHEPEHGSNDRSKYEESCEYRGPTWFAGFYCFFALHDKFWVAFGTLILAVGTGVLGFATVFLWRATRDLVRDAKTTGAEQLKISVLAAEAAKESADVAKATLVSANRPWISADFAIDSDLIFNVSGTRITIRYVMKNIGNTPGIRIVPHVKLMLLEFGTIVTHLPGVIAQAHNSDPTAVLRELCEFGRSLENPEFADHIKGDAIFPNETLVDRVTMSLSAEEIERAKKSSAHKVISPVFLICFNYVSPLEKVSHQTGYIFLVTTDDSRHPNGIDPTKGDIARGGLALMRYPFSSSFAD